MDASLITEVDGQYRLLREECGQLSRADRGYLLVSGPESAEYLQGQVTNDVESLQPGEGAYAALLERKAHIKADMNVLRLDGETFLLDAEAEAVGELRGHLDMYKIGREVRLADRTGELASVMLIGPGCAERVPTRPASELGHELASVDGVDCRVVRSPVGSVPAFDLICDAAEVSRVQGALESAGVPEVSAEALEILRVEAGVPRYGRELTLERMPAEAGIVDRAVSFTKGCYIGQEPVARLHYRGRPNRLLRAVELSEPCQPGASLELDGKAVGELTSAVVSPARGPIGLAIVRRQAEPGARIDVAGSEATATIIDPGDREEEET